MHPPGIVTGRPILGWMCVSARSAQVGRRCVRCVRTSHPRASSDGARRRSPHDRGAIVAVTFATHHSDGMQTRTEELTTPTARWASTSCGPTATGPSRSSCSSITAPASTTGRSRRWPASPSGATTSSATTATTGRSRGTRWRAATTTRSRRCSAWCWARPRTRSPRTSTPCWPGCRPTRPPAAAPWAASATASARGRCCAPSATAARSSVPVSACTRRSARPTTATHPTWRCRPTPGRSTSGSARPTRCSRHRPTAAHRGDQRPGQGRGRDPRRRRPRVRRLRPRLPRSRRDAVLRAGQGHVRPRAPRLTRTITRRATDTQTITEGADPSAGLRPTGPGTAACRAARTTVSGE